MSVFQFRKTPLHRQGDPVENTGNFTCDPRQHESTECGFHHFSGVSGIFQLLCVGLRTRKWGRLREGAESYAKALASDILR